MKIISKYKDFYDFLTTDYDSDVTYVRNPEIIRKNYEDLFDLKHRNSIYGDTIYKYPGYVSIDNFTFGIYPYVYAQPYFKVCINSAYGTEVVNIIPSKACIDELITIKDTTELENKICTYCMNSLYKNEEIKEVYIPNKLKMLSTYNLKGRISDNTYKIECKEIFNKLNAPVYVWYDYKLFNNTVYAEKICEGKVTDIRYVTNVCFNKLSNNILKYWFDELNNINTYINIENFLWSVKQEPIANPNNKTKILLHGFDLKTSFRKM